MELKKVNFYFRIFNISKLAIIILIRKIVSNLLII